MTTRYPASETDPSGQNVETDNADLNKAVSVRLPQASDPCQASVINAPAKELRDRLALVEAGVVWHDGATNAPVNTQPITLQISELIPGVQTVVKPGTYDNASIVTKCDGLYSATPKMVTEVAPSRINLGATGQTGPDREICLQCANSANKLDIGGGFRGASDCLVAVKGSVSATSDVSAGGNISATGDIGAGGKVTATGKVRAPNIPAIITGYFTSSTSKWTVMADGVVISTTRQLIDDVRDDIIAWCNTNGFTGSGFTLFFGGNPTADTTSGDAAYKPGVPSSTNLPSSAKSFVFVSYPA